MERLRLTSPLLAFWVDVSVLTHEGRWVAVAIIASEPEIGMATTRNEAIARALTCLGREASSSLLESVTA